MLRIGDKVNISLGKNKSAFIYKGILIDMKWNLGLVKLSTNETEWFDLTRIHKASE